MKIMFGEGEGPEVIVELTGDEVATAIHAWLLAHSVSLDGARITTVNGQRCKTGKVYIYPPGHAIDDGVQCAGRGDGASGHGIVS